MARGVWECNLYKAFGEDKFSHRHSTFQPVIKPSIFPKISTLERAKLVKSSPGTFTEYLLYNPAPHEVLDTQM